MHQIKFVLKDFSQIPSHQVSHIGGELANGIRWKITAKEALEGIRSGITRYFVRFDGGLKEYLTIGNHPLYGAFLTVEGDTREPKKLMGMPEVLVQEA